MAYYGNYPQNYPQFPQNYPQNFQQPYQQNFQNQPQQTQQIQNGGFVSIRGEVEARNYPIAVGTSITFKDETAPYIYTKTMGFSQLDTPRFEKFRLVKEDVPVVNAEPSKTEEKKGNIDLSIYVTKTEFEAFKSLVESLEGEIDKLKPKKSKKEAVEDD